MNWLNRFHKYYKMPNYKGFVLHVEEWDELGIPYSLWDLMNLAKKYNTPVPKKYGN